jgi:sugar phosphate isomerase/epimerase
MNDVSRRGLLKTFGAGLAGLTLPSVLRADEAAPKLALGYDNFAVRAMGWKADRLLDHAIKLRCDSLFISDLDAFESLETGALKALRERATAAGVGIHVGTWSVCSSSVSFRGNRGSADEHLALGIRVAKDLGSPVIRVILGNGEDRRTPGGIQARIADMVKTLKAARGAALEAGVMIAVENHAGDLRASELADLVNRAGRDFVGVNLDAGNSVWTLEDPIEALKVLGPLTVTTSLRDSMVWKTDAGAAVQWTAMGEGLVDWKAYFELFGKLCPNVPVHIETISGFNRELKFRGEELAKNWPGLTAADLAPFERLAARGRMKAPWSAPAGVDRKKAEQDYQLGEIQRSLDYCRSIGLGRR